LSEMQQVLLRREVAVVAFVTDSSPSSTKLVLEAAAKESVCPISSRQIAKLTPPFGCCMSPCR
jgi:hypothetical protein